MTAAALCTALAACGGGSPAGPSGPSVWDDPAVTVLVSPGEQFVIRLESNHTTGYQWRLAGSLDQSVVMLLGSRYQAPDGPLGAGGEERWTFLAVGRGDARLSFDYVRPWEPGVPPVRTAVFAVSVR